MTTLVEQLRAPSSVKSWAEADAQRAEAADAIERLEADTKEVNAARIYLREKEGLLRKLEMAEACLAGDGALITGLKNEINDITKQRDDLLAALEKAKRWAGDSEAAAILDRAIDRAKESE